MKIKEDLLLKNIAGAWIVVPMGERLLEFNELISINESGAFIWNQLTQAHTKEEIAKALLNEYEIDEDKAALEVDDFIEALFKANVLEL